VKAARGAPRHNHFITAQTSGHNFGPDALAKKQCRARVLAALGRALGVGLHGPVPPCLSDHAKSERTCWSVLALAAVGALQPPAARGATAERPGALEEYVNALIDTTFYFGCCPSSKAADVVPKGAPAIRHTQPQHTTLLMHLKCCNFRPTGPLRLASLSLRAGCAMDGAVGLMLPRHWRHWPSRRNDIRHQSACDQLLGLRQLAGTSAAQ
jgi:hypothetical protein